MSMPFQDRCGKLSLKSESFHVTDYSLVKYLPMCSAQIMGIQKVLHIPIKIKVVVFYFKLYKYIV